jgi:hypothetical protein
VTQLSLKRKGRCPAPPGIGSNTHLGGGSDATRFARVSQKAQGPPDAAPKSGWNPPVQPRFGGQNLRVFLKGLGSLRAGNSRAIVVRKGEK